MRKLRRPNGHAPTPQGAALSGVVAGDTSFADGVMEVTDGNDLCEIEVTKLGLVMRSIDEPVGKIPALVPWCEVRSINADAAGQFSDGISGQVLEVAVDSDDWFGAERARRLVVPATDVAAFLMAVPDQYKTESAGGYAGVTAAPASGLRALSARWFGDGVLGGSDPQHGLGRRRLGPVLVGVLALILLTGSASTTFGSAASAGSGNGASAEVTADQGNGLQASQQHPSSKLPAATSVPNPSPPSLAGSPVLQSHEVFGYAPYWTLPQSSGFDVQDLTTLAYFSVDANPDGTLDQSGPGWNGYESQDLVNLVNRSHAAGDRVVLTVTDFSQSSLDAITSNPQAAANLSAALISALTAKNLDGVNFDFEGEGSADRAGLTALITQVSNALHAANPHWQVTMAVYASAAADSGGFYDVAALAPALDGFFVMAYDMNSRSSPSATSPLVGGGYNDTEALQQFTAVVPAQKVILGVPFYGYDWPTANGNSGAAATGPESPLSDGVIAASGHPTYWDPTTQTAWTSYQVGTQWHETYFDNPTSLALKAQLANSFHIAGLGIWALGMDGNNPAMLAALLGNAPPAKNYQTGPTTTAPSSATTVPAGPTGSGYTTTGTWAGQSVALTPVNDPGAGSSAQYLGTLSQISTTDPALSCLETSPPISVWTFNAFPGMYVAVASQPDDCADAMWVFPPPTVTKTSGGSPPTTTTTTLPPPTTTTTKPPPPTTTTTTTTTVPPTTTTTVEPGNGAH